MGGDVMRRPGQELKATANGVGTVSYYGDPMVRRTVSGLGSISAKTEP